METEYQAAIKAIEGAIQMEVEGRDFYVTASQKVTWPEGKATLLDLARDEEEHIRILKAEHASLMDGKDWIAAEVAAPRMAEEKPIKVFEKDEAKIEGMIDDWANSEDVLDVAIKNEYNSAQYYIQQRNQATNPDAKRIFEWLVKEEKGHQKTLTDYALYIGAQSEWLLERERPLAEG